MKRRQIVAGVITLLSAAGLSLGLGLTASAGAATTHAATGHAGATHTGTTHAAATKASPQYVVQDCDFKSVVEPGTYVIACADGGLGISGMHWTTWGQHLASGYGTSWENLCVPNCAEGKIAHYPVLAVFWGRASVKGHPAERRYTELTLIYTGSRPPYYQLINGKVVKTYPPTLTVPAN